MKSISPGTVTIGVLAIVLGLVGVYVARRAMEPERVVKLKEEPRRRPDPGPTVVYARVNLPAKTRITDRDLGVKRLKPGEERPAGSVGDEAEIIGRLTREAIRAGTLLNDDVMFGIGEGPNPADLIPVGHVAVTIDATETQINRGLVRMGARVNVALTVTDEDLGVGQLTKTILENALVIATSDEDFELPSPNMSQRERQRLQNLRGAEANQITIAVTQEDSDRLHTAQQYGDLSLTLRSFDGAPQPVPNNGIAGTTPVKIEDILDIEPKPIEEIPVIHVPTPPRVHRVERWNGNSLEVIEFPADRISEANDATLADQIRTDTVPVNINNGR